MHLFMIFFGSKIVRGSCEDRARIVKGPGDDFEKTGRGLRKDRAMTLRRPDED